MRKIQYILLPVIVCLTVLQACGENVPKKERLFPMDLPGPEWVDFEAAGFDAAVTGVSFPSNFYQPGMPLGGLGTGSICLGTDGTLDYYSTVFNNYMERRYLAQGQCATSGENVDHRMRRRFVPEYRRAFLLLEIDGDVRSLSSRYLQRRTTQWEVPHTRYWGHYPVADMQFDIPDFPVTADLRAWSPFLPGQPEKSNTPGAVFQVNIHNKSDQKRKGTLALNFLGPREAEVGGPSRFTWQECRGEFSGVHIKTQREDQLYSYALGLAGDLPVRVGGDVLAHWCPDSLATLPPAGEGPAATVAVDFDLQAHETKTFYGILGWYAPAWRSQVRPPYPDGGHGFDGKVFWGPSRMINQYAGRFGSALDVARTLAREHEDLLDRILAWQAEIYREKRLPGWLQDSAINIFAILALNSFWVRNADPAHWWGPEGLFCVNESLLSCPAMGCIANDEFGEWPVNLFFPQLARNKLRVFKHHQKENGQTPFGLGHGTEADTPWYNQQLPVEGQAYIHLIDRIWQASGDDTILQEFYPSVKKAFDFIKTLDTDRDGLIEVKGSNQYYDFWPELAGPAIHISGYWLATIRIVQRMATEMQDPEVVTDCENWIQRGSRTLEEKLWNEPLGSYLIYNEVESGNKSDSILSDQLIGQWFAHLHRLPPVFPEERVRRTMDTIWSHNVKAAKFGVRIAIKPDLTDLPGFYSMFQCPSYSSLVPAMLQIYNGYPEKGLDLMHEIWHLMVIEQPYAWDMPAHLHPSGEVSWGIAYYHNTMLWTLPAAVLGQDLRTFCSPQGLAGRIMNACKGSGGNR